MLWLSEMRRGASTAMLGLVLFATLRCQSDDTHPPFIGENSLGSGGKHGDGGLFIPDAAPEADGLCGDQTIFATTTPPNLYFVVDRSGSMSDPWPGIGGTKYETARIAIGNMLRPLGARVRYGAAYFPMPALGSMDFCIPGKNIFPVARGEKPPPNGDNGPILDDLLNRLNNGQPSGESTPTASTLLALTPELQALSGKTFVILMTDGGPNCNDALTCDASGCMPNIEGAPGCTSDVNCCDPVAVGPGNPVGECVDSASTTAAVKNLAALGIDTYVVGMPGAEPYADVLSALAIAGGTARPTGTEYYAVSETSELNDALTAIGSQVAISCDIPLAEPPASQLFVNIAFDGKLVPPVPDGGDDGWAWTGPQSLQIRGSWCSELLSGNVLVVQVLAGCATIPR
jgi:hypothetical protein